MKSDLVYFKNLLEKNGHNFTVTRKKVLEAVLDSKTHLNVKELYEKVKEKDKSIGLATVYRALNIFNDLGIVKEINANGISYYEKKIFSGKPLHIHFKCFRCNSIIDVDSKSLNLEYLKLNKKLEEENNLEIYDSNIMFEGLCSKCKEELKNK
ncbi:transcriptional repressor [Clostridium oceanicum]|uniref:Fur family transcriptional regulator n=1 Tax=Clostridium oceanicum TaxID=1543 RepID=A0ABN1JJH0_9CLOT